MVIESQIIIGGLETSYVSVGDATKAIIFLHGNSCNKGMWQKQLEDSELCKYFRILAVDLPGHGSSGKSNDYSFNYLGQFVRSFISQLNIDEYIIVGFSYSTCLIGETAPNLPGCKGIFLASVNLTNNQFNPSVWIVPFAEAGALVMPAVDDVMINGLADKLFLNPNEPYKAEFMNGYKKADPNFRTSVGTLIATAGWTDEIANIQKMHVPFALVFGKEEKIIHTEYLNGIDGNWKNQIFLIENSAHFMNIEQPALFNQLLLEFAKDMWL